MKIRRNSPDTITVHQCVDTGWTGAVRSPRTEYQPNTGVLYKTTVSFLTCPDEKRWKSTGYEIVGREGTDGYLFPQCDDWSTTHTTTEGWTLPPEPTTTP
jgi:hypothetical protein